MSSCDPYRWIPEAARILRSGGRLVFLGISYLLMLTIPDADHPATDRLQRPHFGKHMFPWSANLTGAVEFHLPHGQMPGCSVAPVSRSRTSSRSAPLRSPERRRRGQSARDGRVVSPLAEEKGRGSHGSAGRVATVEQLYT